MNVELDRKDIISLLRGTTPAWSVMDKIPKDDETKHLLGTSDEAPEYYRYWED